MPLPASGQLDMGSINSEFRRGYDLNTYRGVQWWNSALGTGFFSSGQISMAEFYDKHDAPRVTSTGFSGATATASLETITWTHTTPARTDCLVVFAYFLDSSGPTTANNCTFNGVAMTRETTQTVSGNHIVHVFTLFNPPIGAYTVQLSYAGTIDRFAAGASLGVTNVSRVNVKNQAGGANVSGGTLSVAMTPTAECVVLFGVFLQREASATLPSLTGTGPGTIADAGSSTNTSNSIAKRATTFYSDPRPAGALSASATVTNVTYNTRSITGICLSK